MTKVHEDLKQYKDLELSSTNTNNKDMIIEETEEKLASESAIVKRNESVSFFNGDINVAAVSIGVFSTDIQIGADGFESVIHYSAKVGNQYIYEADSKYQVRLTKLDSNSDQIEIQVTEL